LRDYIEERIFQSAAYIIENGATVRDAARVFKISKSTVPSARIAACDLRS
jgi:putative DeoR family transcriptional regulator (stage III sporulation protein D)